MASRNLQHFSFRYARKGRHNFLEFKTSKILYITFEDYRVKLFTFVLLLVTCCVLAVSPSQAAQTNPVSYAVHSAALSATITYCRTKYGTLRPKSTGQQCFNRARDALQEVDLKAATIRIERQCADSTTLSTCLTPEIGDVVLHILDVFDSKKF